MLIGRFLLGREYQKDGIGSELNVGVSTVQFFAKLDDFLVFDVVFKLHGAFDHTFVTKLDDAVGDSVDKLVVVGGEQDHFGELDQTFVE